MARRTQFSQLVTMLQDEIGASSVVGVGVDSLPSLKRAINRVYSELYNRYNWPHLRVVSPLIPLSAGERYYDFPEEVSYERVEEVCVWWSSKPIPLDRGVGFEEYAAFDPAADQRVDPALRWDTRWMGTAVQLEVWPLPASNNQSLQIIGYTPAPRLVADADTCLIDDEIVVLFAAARLLKRKDSKDADTCLSEAQELLKVLMGRTGTSKRVRVGLGNGQETNYQGRVTVNVRG